MADPYTRRPVGDLILKALQSLGGSASKKAIKEEIVADSANDITYEKAFEPVFSKKTGNPYYPFTLDFDFGIRNLHTCGYIEDYARRKDITLTEKGRNANYAEFPTPEEKEKSDRDWEKRIQLRAERKGQRQASIKNNDTSIENNETVAPATSYNPPLETDISIDDEEETDDESNENWRITILEQIKQFSAKKFESFSRLLISKMGVKLDREKGINMSSDQGIDGFGYFESDEFRTAKVVIQCKRFTDTAVSSTDIDKFKGVMSSFSADYGIFITTSHFTKHAQAKAVQGANIVTLIDGQRLVDLVEKYQLYITPVHTYVLEDYYFQKD